MDAREIRGWLLCQPRPAVLRITAGDDSQHEIDVKPGQSWATIAASIEALQPELIEALDPERKLIRAVRPREQETGEETAVVGRRPASESELVTMSKLLAEAYRHANEVAFARMVDLFEAVNRRSETLERSLDALHKIIRKDLEEKLAGAADGEQDPLSQLVGAFAAGAAGMGGAPPNGAATTTTNGKGKA